MGSNIKMISEVFEIIYNPGLRGELPVGLELQGFIFRTYGAWCGYWIFFYQYAAPDGAFGGWWYGN